MTDSPQEPKYAGARFYKCALQVNSCTYAKNFQGGSVQDEEAYNQAILDQCKEHDIKVVGLADHGKVETSQSLRDFLAKNNIVVFPGFEISSSEKIHMVCLYPQETSPAQLNQYLGQLMGENASRLNDTPEHPSSKSCEEIAKTLKEQKGFWYAAHMTGKNGLLRLTGDGDNYADLWKQFDLVIAGQIPGTPDDLEEVNREDLQKYKQIIENKNPDYKRDKPIVVINAKDIDKPETLAYPSASCLIKMTEPTFEAFCMAFKDPESRIRLNHKLPKAPYSVIKSVEWKGGGFFRDLDVSLSKHLNAVIGGRGTGKSTLIESIRYALDLPFQGNNADEKARQSLIKNTLSNCQITIRVKSKAQNGEEYTIRRRYGELPQVINKDDDISRLKPSDILPGIDLIGQNEILAIERSDSAKRELMQRFLPGDAISDEEMGVLKERLKKNRIKYISAAEEFEELRTSIQQAPGLQERQKQFEKLGITEKLTHVKTLEKEDDIKKSIKNQFDFVNNWLDDYSKVFDLLFLDDQALDPLPNKEILKKIREILQKLKKALDTRVGESRKSLDQARSTYDELEERWVKDSEAIKEQLNQAIAKLPEHEGKSGQAIGNEYQEVIRELQKIEGQRGEYRKQKTLLKTLEQERNKILEKYRLTAFNRYTAMHNAVEYHNRTTLKGKVQISVLRCADREDLKEFLRKIDGIGDSKVARLDKITDVIDLKQWSKWIEKGNGNAFISKYPELGLTESTAKNICGIGLERRLKLEEIEMRDTVNIELNVKHTTQDSQEELYVPLENLSTGQKCTAILNLLLISRDDPLFIDQPEDHLDNAFIADRIVSDIRYFKTNRQFLFTTHNANIPVFGDAELIVVLENNNNTGEIVAQGSIDKDTVKGHTANILEGGREAFNMRKDKYGF